jgi:Zn-dependent protease
MQEIDVLLALMIIGSFLIAIPLHEFAHAQVAAWLGDHSPSTDERRTLSIRVHIDPVGLLMNIILAFQSMSGLGWGRPVKPDPWKMRVSANTGVLLVACAGPIFSLIIGLVFAGITYLIYPFLSGNFWTIFILKLVVAFSCVNTSLAIFNIIPLYPLDGYQILYTLLPSKQAVQFSRSSPMGPFVILIIFFFLPFLAQFLGAFGTFPLFHLAEFIQSLALQLNSLVSGIPATIWTRIYTYPNYF